MFIWPMANRDIFRSYIYIPIKINRGNKYIYIYIYMYSNTNKKSKNMTKLHKINKHLFILLSYILYILNSLAIIYLITNP